MCLYLYLVIDVWSRKVVAWDVAEREDRAIAADLVSTACLREERISKGRKQPLVLHAENRYAMRAATLYNRLEERACSGPFPNHGYRMTTRTRNRFVEQRNTCLTTQDGHLRAKTRPVSWWCHLWISTTTRIAIAASST